jgi:hydroxypyruvate isomerase
MTSSLSRRSAVKKMAGAAAVFSVASSLSESASAAASGGLKLKGNIHHSVSAWCYGSLFNPGRNNQPAKMTFEDFCRECAKLGLESVELLGPDEWPTVKKAGLTCAMCNGPDRIDYGWNLVEHHDDLVAKFQKAIPQVAAAGFPNIITFSGNRRGMSDELGLENCVKGLKRIVGVAEKEKINVILELLNSKVNHKDYMADHTAWGVEVCKRVGSERLKLLYDIYHMQIMEGDLIRSIKDNSQYIGHYHTGGNPGRNEIDDSQEICHKAVMKAIVATGYKGFVGQEFVPTRDPLTSLKEAIQICDV